MLQNHIFPQADQYLVFYSFFVHQGSEAGILNMDEY
jgi:hypothetical protein